MTQRSTTLTFVPQRSTTLTFVPEEWGFISVAVLNSAGLDRLFLLYPFSTSVQCISYICRMEVQETFSYNNQFLQIGLGNCSIAGCQEPIKFSLPLYSHLLLHLLTLLPAFSITRQKAIAKSGQIDMEPAHTGLVNVICHICVLILIDKMGPFTSISWTIVCQDLRK